MRTNLLFLFLLLISFMWGQEVTIIVPGLVTNYNTKERINGTSLYILQNGMTLAKGQSDNKGNYTISTEINKDVSFEMIVSKPGYMSKKVLFDTKKIAIPRGLSSITIKLVEELQVELFPTKSGVNIKVGEKDYAEKFTWNEALSRCEPDESYKKQEIDKVLAAFKDAELMKVYSGFRAQSTTFERVQNYPLAIQYLDSATKVGIKDSTIALKRIELQKAQDTQEKEVVKQNEITKTLAAADSLLSILKWKEAEVKYNEVLKKDPNHAKAKNQLSQIASLKAQDEKRKNELKLHAANRSNGNKLAQQKKFKEAIVSFNKSLALSIPQTEKDKISVSVDSINKLLKGENIEKGIKIEIAKAKAANVKGDFQLSKISYDLIEGLISNLSNPTLQGTYRTEVNKQILQYLDAEMKKAYELNTKNNYDQAIEAYKRVGVLISSLTDENLKKDKLEEVQGRIVEVHNKRKDDERKYKESLAAVQRALDSASFNPDLRMTQVQNILNKEPLKSKSNAPEVLALKDRLTKVKGYYGQRKLKIKEISQKDSIKALSTAEALVTLASTSDVGPFEMKKITFSRDSIKAIISVKKITKPNTRGIALVAPGTEVKGGVQGAYNELELYRKLNEDNVKDAWDNLKTQVDVENEYNALKELERQKQAEKVVENILDQNDAKSQQEEDAHKARELKNVALVDQTQYSINKKNELHLTTINGLADSALEIQDQLDVVHEQRNNENDSDRKLGEKYADNANDQRDVIKSKENDEHLSRVNSQRDLVSTNEVDKFNREQESELQHKNHQRIQEEKADYVDERTFQPNYLRDENGACFPWNAMTEKVYELKNAQGYTSRVIIRRVVVNINGYGVVYEQTTNESGIHSFTLNGSTIPESIWMHESTGEPVIDSNKKVETPCE